MKNLILLLLLLPTIGHAHGDIKGAPAAPAAAEKEYTMEDAQAECKAPGFILPAVIHAGDKEAILIFCVTPTDMKKPDPTKWFYKLLHVVLPVSNNTPATDL